VGFICGQQTERIFITQSTAIHFISRRQCFTSNDVAYNANIYYSNCNNDCSYKAGSVCNLPLDEKLTFYSNKKNFMSQNFESAFYIKANGAKALFCEF
jgi:hypothetical protein